MVDFKDLADKRYLGIAALLLAAVVTGGLVQLTVNSGTGDSAVHERKFAAAGTGSPVALELKGDTSANSQSIEQERKRVTRYFIDLEVPEVEKAIDETKELAKSYGGYMRSSSFDREDGDRGELEVRVPDSNVSEFLGQVEKNWKVESSRKSVEDVTERYTQLKLELENKRQELRRLEELMNQSDSVENTIRIQERMSELRSRIQFLENELSQLDTRVEYSTIRISYEEPQPITHEFELRESFRQGYRGVFASLNLMIVGFGYLFPFLLLGGIIYKGRNLWREVKGKD